MNWPLLTVLHAVPTLCLCGLIWFVQIVHYPLFTRVGATAFFAYHQEHCRRTKFVVMPCMLAEGGLAAWAWWLAPAAWWSTTTLGLVLLAAIWASTFLLQVPLHRRLERGFDAGAARQLIATNWVRTAAWTARGALAVWLVLDAAAG
jgi:hypothetical protein